MLRILINRLECESDECEDSNPLDRPNDFSPLLERFEIISIPNNISSLLTAIANKCADDWMIGDKSLG